jgi:1,4-alpha-glucan branching enzyme
MAQTAPAPAQVVVRLVLIEPTARSVAIVGDFNGWDPSGSQLERLPDGVWTTTLALPAGRYHYQFLVDGERWVADPLAQETTFDGFDAQNSVLDVGA